MTASQSQTSRPPHLEDLVGAPAHLTRVGDVYDGRGTLMLPDLHARWLRCPEVGKPLWLLVGETNWVRTSPVEAILIDESAWRVVSVRTHDARYRFVFDTVTASNA